MNNCRHNRLRIPQSEHRKIGANLGANRIKSESGVITDIKEPQSKILRPLTEIVKQVIISLVNH